MRNWTSSIKVLVVSLLSALCLPLVAVAQPPCRPVGEPVVGQPTQLGTTLTLQFNNCTTAPVKNKNGNKVKIPLRMQP